MTLEKLWSLWWTWFGESVPYAGFLLLAVLAVGLFKNWSPIKFAATCIHALEAPVGRFRVRIIDVWVAFVFGLVLVHWGIVRIPHTGVPGVCEDMDRRSKVNYHQRNFWICFSNLIIWSGIWGLSHPLVLANAEFRNQIANFIAHLQNTHTNTHTAEK
eukprot:GDKI01047726.1.p1 GENE.GDKI01047726.1~~GDKI01047726.1.p1  ORF type:complete len:158 (-),score=21.80 GDKI01047726.1:2-475(-)